MSKKEVSKPMHVQVAEKVIEGLKARTAPWQIPWDAGGIPFILPYNLQSGKRYRGINSISLLMSGREDPRWMTYKQAEESGFQVRKGEKSMMIQFIKTSEERTRRDASGKILHDELGKPITERMQLPHAIVRNAYVFNADQIEGMPKLELQKPGGLWEPLERAEKLIISSGANINHENSGNAFYDPRTDAITLPHKEWFSAGDRYYATLLHELGHWTAHPDRLNRDMGKGFATESYAREELKAEIASMLLGQELGIGHDPGQHYAYVDSWISILENNPFEIFSASMDAERIFSYVIGLEKGIHLSAAEQELRAIKAPAAKTVNFLTTGDNIQYNGAVYQVLGHLKQGRLKIQESLNGNVFTLSRQDRLYSALSFLKNQMGREESHGHDHLFTERSDNNAEEINR